MKRVLIINGPNLNLLGTREPEIYGNVSYDKVNEYCEEWAKFYNITAIIYQSNHEGDIVDKIQENMETTRAIIINAGAYSHTSIAIMDALKAYSGIIYEVHLSNTFKRSAFRHKSFISNVADGVICGFGPLGYKSALEAINNSINSDN